MPETGFSLPDYHFLMIAPTLGAEWFFGAARRYWQLFKPTVISDFGLLAIIPERYTIAVTVVARRDTGEFLREQLTQIAPQAFYDPVIYDFVEDLQLTLDSRTDLYQPLGVPVPATATPTITPTIPATAGPAPSATPMPTRPPGGFITQTPSIPGVPSPTPPIGPVTGGSGG